MAATGRSHDRCRASKWLALLVRFQQLRAVGTMRPQLSSARWLVVTVAWAVVGCSAPATPGPADVSTPQADTASNIADLATTDASDGPTITMKDVPAAFVAARCSAYSNCSPSPKWFASVEGCKSWHQTNAPGYPFGSWLQWVEQGGVHFDANKAVACIAAAKDCASINGMPQVCYDMLSPTVANKGKCESNVVCISGFCKDEGWQGGPLCGVCGPPDTATLGGSCASLPCPSGASCAGWPTPTCVKTGSGAVGEKCGGASCATSLYCQSPNDGPEVCKEFSKIGVPCTANKQCAAGLVCAAKSASEKQGLCSLPRSEGDVCFRFNPPGIQQSAGDDCGGANICGVIGDWNGQGSPEARCVPRRTLGQACVSHWQCGMLDAVCIAGNCGPLPAPGQPCVKAPTANYCGPQMQCGSGTCVAVPGLGQPCKDLCANGSVCRADKVTGAKTCVLFGQPGAPCANDTECGGVLLCGNGTCYQGKCP